MAITTMAMVTTVFVLNLYSSHEKPVPRWVKRLLLDILAPLLCMCTCTRPVPRNVRSSTRRSRASRRTGRNVSDVTQRASDSVIPGLRTAEDSDVRGECGAGHATRTSNHIPQRSRRHALGGRRMAESGANAKQWVYVATVCDRLFFWICLICIVITTMILFHPLMFKDTIKV